jgi:hypothetical protein
VSWRRDAVNRQHMDRVLLCLQPLVTMPPSATISICVWRGCAGYSSGTIGGCRRRRKACSQRRSCVVSRDAAVTPLCSESNAARLPHPCRSVHVQRWRPRSRGHRHVRVEGLGDQRAEAWTRVMMMVTALLWWVPWMLQRVRHRGHSVASSAATSLVVWAQMTASRRQSSRSH